MTLLCHILVCIEKNFLKSKLHGLEVREKTHPIKPTVEYPMLNPNFKGSIRGKWQCREDDKYFTLLIALQQNTLVLRRYG